MKKRTPAETKTTSALVDPDVAIRLRKVADRLNIGLEALIALIIRNHVRRHT